MRLTNQSHTCAVRNGCKQYKHEHAFQQTDGLRSAGAQEANEHDGVMRTHAVR